MVFITSLLQEPQNHYKQQQNIGFLDRLALRITEVMLFPIKLITLFFMMPILIPLAICHQIMILSINTFLILTLFTVLIASILIASEIMFPLGLITSILITLLAINVIHKNQQNIFNIDEFLQKFDNLWLI